MAMMANPASDLELVEAAVAAYGNAARLARAYGVKPNTPNQWIRNLRKGGSLSSDKREKLLRLLAERHDELNEYLRDKVTHHERVEPFLATQLLIQEIRMIPDRVDAVLKERLEPLSLATQVLTKLDALLSDMTVRDRLRRSLGPTPARAHPKAKPSSEG